MRLVLFLKMITEVGCEIFNANINKWRGWRLMKRIVAILVFLLCGGFLAVGSAFALPAEYTVLDPTDLVATDAEMQAIMTAYWTNEKNTEPAYFIWTNDESRFEWNIAWTGGYGDSTDNFWGFILLDSAETDEFIEVSWDSSDTLSYSTDAAKFDAYAWDYFDGIKFTITDYESPSYVGFDLFVGLDVADADYIFLGKEMQTVSSLGGDQDFSIAAPVPEPASIFLFGCGLLGFAGLSKKKLWK